MTNALRVLLVEDNPADADLTKDTLLASKLLLQIDVVSDGEEALDYLRGRGAHATRELPDLILLDLNLPRVSGREVLAEIRSDATLRPIPIVILTSSDADADILNSYQLGANCFVTKPVGLEAFRSIVSAVESFWFTVVRLP